MKSSLLMKYILKIVTELKLVELKILHWFVFYARYFDIN